MIYINVNPLFKHYTLTINSFVWDNLLVIQRTHDYKCVLNTDDMHTPWRFLWLWTFRLHIPLMLYNTKSFTERGMWQRRSGILYIIWTRNDESVSFAFNNNLIIFISDRPMCSFSRLFFLFLSVSMSIVVFLHLSWYIHICVCVCDCVSGLGVDCWMRKQCFVIAIYFKTP